MTAENNDEIESTDGTAVAALNKNSFYPTDNSTVNEILEFLARNPKILFKSQQIDDPEITISEKMSIAYLILTESNEKFLQRFGKYLLTKHLQYFQNSNNTENHELQYIIRNLQKTMEERKKDVKNRRFTALKKMVKKNEYFNEIEMMKREPHLYEQFIGQYLTDTEKKIRDGFDPSNTPFSEILLDGIDKDQTEELRKKQAKYDFDVADESTQSSNISKTITNSEDIDDKNTEEMYPKIPASFRKHWGNFEDESSGEKQNNQPSTSYKLNASDNNKKKDNEQKYITASEREMLRQEFVEIMYSKFLEGQDKDFNYSEVDDNTDFDDLEQINQDKEDEYFDEDENDSEKICIQNDDSDDDDLDIYMKHLNEHPTLKRSFQ